MTGYEALRVLGRGGFATVYSARQVAFDRDVALKVLDGAATDNRTLELFTRECRAAGRLSWHPHVVPVYDAGTTARGMPYLSMELLPGGSLDDALATRGPLDPDDAVRYGAQIAAALGAAHGEGLLHRDVKPANVLVDRLGRARMVDFGISRVVGPGTTTTGTVAGTVAYLSPEVLDGQRASPASDVYALGVTLVTLLTGRNPYVSDTDESPFVVVGRVMAGTRPVLPGTLSPSLRDLLEACLERDPADRPASAVEVERALTDGTPVRRRGLSASATVPVDAPLPRPPDRPTPPGGTPPRSTPPPSTAPSPPSPPRDPTPPHGPGSGPGSVDGVGLRMRLGRAATPPGGTPPRPPATPPSGATPPTGGRGTTGLRSTVGAERHHRGGSGSGDRVGPPPPPPPPPPGAGSGVPPALPVWQRPVGAAVAAAVLLVWVAAVVIVTVRVFPDLDLLLLASAAAVGIVVTAGVITWGRRQIR